jgi:site-specific recombinase XerC
VAVSELFADKHFYPFFGAMPMAKISPSLVQDWVTKATVGGLSRRSVKKYHTVLHSIFKRAVRDGLLVRNPCDGTELPKDHRPLSGETATDHPDDTASTRTVRSDETPGTATAEIAAANQRIEAPFSH